MHSRKDKVLEMLKRSWNILQKRVLKESFDPQTEADIQCFLYHCLVERLGTAKSIHAEIPHEEGFADLVIDNRIFVEIKYILRSGIRTPKRWENRKQIVEKEDIGKLRRLMKKRSNIVGVLAIYARSYKEDDESWYKVVRESCDESGIILLRAWKRKV